MILNVNKNANEEYCMEKNNKFKLDMLHLGFKSSPAYY